MPELYDKHGSPKLWATITCLVPNCGAKRTIEPLQAEALARRLEAGIGIRYLIKRFKCRSCGHRNAAISFHLAYAGKQPWTPRQPPAYPHRGGEGTITDLSMAQAHANLPVVVRGRGTKRKRR